MTGPNADVEDESIAADTVPESVSEEEEAPGWSILPTTISEMESEDEEKDSKAAPHPPSREKCPARLRPWTRTMSVLIKSRSSVIPRRHR